MKAILLTDARKVVTLFAGFTIGMHLAVLLHELGHVLGYWLSGGTITAVVMQAPLPAGHVEGLGRLSDSFMQVWGGVTFGTLMAPVLLFSVRRLGRGSPVRFAGLLAAAFCLGHNGMYLFVGSLLPFSDAYNMIALGAPRWLLFLLGVPLIVGFVLVLESAIQVVGLRPTESVSKWIIVVELGLWSFPAFMATAMLFMPVPREILVPTIAFVGCYAAFFGVAAYRTRTKVTAMGTDDTGTQMPQNWLPTFALIVAAVLLIGAEWLAFSRRTNG